MVLFNYSTKEITAKIVYYGPGLCGKTTNLQFIYDNLPRSINKGKMLSLATKTDRTLFFDFLPIDLGTIRGMRTRLQLYTVPGQVFYNTTRKLVLKGADGIVFVADSQRQMSEPNLESMRNLEENLSEHDLNLSEIPLIIQFNKRDLPDVSSIEELNTELNKYNAPIYEAVATTGIGVHETLKAITRVVLNSLKEKYADKREQQAEPPSRAVAAATARAAGAPSPRPTLPVTPAAARPAPVASAAPAPSSARSITAPPPVTQSVGSRTQPGFELPEIPDLDTGETVEPPRAHDAASIDSGIVAPPLPPPELLFTEAPAAPFAAPAPATGVGATSDELVLELIDETDLGMAADEDLVLELEEELQPPMMGKAPARVSSAAELGIPMPLDVTEEVSSPDIPKAAPEITEASRSIPLTIEPESRIQETWPEPAPPADDLMAPAEALAVTEDRHEDPLDFPDLVQHSNSMTDLEEPVGLFEEDRSNLAFEPGHPEAIPPAIQARVAGVGAIPVSGQEISLPINLDIGGQSIRFQLRISLDVQSARTGGSGGTPS